MAIEIYDNEVFGLVRPDVDVHTLGIATVGKLLEDCGYRVIYANYEITSAISNISKLDNISLLIKWIIDNKISRIGFSYRLDPYDAQKSFGKVFHLLKAHNQFKEQGGSLNQIYFAGLPKACEIINNEYNGLITTFIGDETQVESLLKFGIPQNKIPNKISLGSKYDDERINFAKELINKGEYIFVKTPEPLNYPTYGTFKDKIVDRIIYNRKRHNLPLMRVHVGPYNPNYEDAKKEFKSWLKQLSLDGFLDVVSIGSSQLSQSDFGKNWGDKPNGGGVPINSEKDLTEIWEASRPMLVRTYAGTKDIPYLASVYEKTINIAWHALSFWWFNRIDGRGSYSVKENLIQHIETLKVIAKSNKPFEPNIPHHFSFRGGDDFTYVLSAIIAAKTAKKYGIKYFILQTMLNTPKYTWGVQDLAKARACLKLVRELEDENFIVFLQPRAGLDYFSPDKQKAKIQLAAVSAMMDDIEPDNPLSPDIIHVVSYCEAVELATPEYINESIKITHSAIQEYRKLKKEGLIDDMRNNSDVDNRTDFLYTEAKQVLEIIENNIPNVYTPTGLYEIFKMGIFTIPYLWEGRDEFADAVKWETALINGSVTTIDKKGKPINPTNRVQQIFLNK
jgi:hypothetical protein